MKQATVLLTVAIGALLMPSTYAEADIRNDVLGSWQGRVKFVFVDLEARASYLAKIERFRDKGFQITKNLNSLGAPGKGFRNQTISYLYPSGRSRSTEYVEGQPVAFGWGRWRIDRSTLFITEKWETDTMSYRMTSRHSLRDSTKMSLQGTLSYGMRWSGSVAKTVDLD